MNRRRTDFHGKRVSCAVNGYPTEIHFDFEHQPYEPAACLSEGYIIGLMFVRLTNRIFGALHQVFGDCVTIHVAGVDVPVSVHLDTIIIGRGQWEVRSEALESVLADHLSELDASNRQDQQDQIAEARRDYLAENWIIEGFAKAWARSKEVDT